MEITLDLTTRVERGGVVHEFSASRPTDLQVLVNGDSRCDVLVEHGQICI